MIKKFIFIFICFFIVANVSMIDNSTNPSTGSVYYSFRKSENSRKYVLWKKTGAGWGNRLLGMIKTVIFSIVFNREILMEHDQYEASFDGNSEWFNKRDKFNQLLKESVSYNSDRWSVDTRVTIIPQGGYDVIPQEWLNVLVEKGIIENPTSIDAWFKIGNLITKSPSKELLERVGQLRRRIQIPDRFNTSVQIRTMKDYSAGHAIAMSKEKQKQIWECISKTVGYGGHTFFTTDETDLFSVAKGKFNSVYYNKHNFEHTSKTKKLIPDSIVEWYLLGEASHVMCSFTTFCITAVSRNYEGMKVTAIENTYKKEDVKCTIIKN